jgi:hypothetical protein
LRISEKTVDRWLSVYRKERWGAYESSPTLHFKTPEGRTLEKDHQLSRFVNTGLLERKPIPAVTASK